MAGTKPNIQLQGNTYYVRVQVPKDVRAVIGKCELRRSLKTSN